MECCFSNFFGLSPLFGMKIIRWNLDPPRSTFALSVCFVFHDFFFFFRFDSIRRGKEQNQNCGESRRWQHVSFVLDLDWFDSFSLQGVGQNQSPVVQAKNKSHATTVMARYISPPNFGPTGDPLNESGQLICSFVISRPRTTTIRPKALVVD